MPLAADSDTLRRDEDALLRALSEGTAAETGAGFFRALVQNLAASLCTSGAWVTEYLEESRRLRALAFWMDGRFIEDYEYDIAGTPCESVVTSCNYIHIPDNVTGLFPQDEDLRAMHAASYAGVALQDGDGRVLGHLSVLDGKPMPEQPRHLAVFRIFAARAAAELRRMRVGQMLRMREAELCALIDSAMDAIVELDPQCRVVRANPAAAKVFGVLDGALQGCDFRDYLTGPGAAKLVRLLRGTRGEEAPKLWIAEAFHGRRFDGTTFPAEASLSGFEVNGNRLYTLILRNIDDRLRAMEEIRALTRETEQLRETIQCLQPHGDILGGSPAMQRVLNDIRQVAPTDATVLVLGETGTGKELVARAIHEAGARRDRPLIKVNCAAIPATLVESEFFGHEAGAFTGATKRRDGRFALADRGTIFLDEVGELPLDLQAKLLRVLQEGEFEPVGSAETRKVDVRVIAATNRDLRAEAGAGRFREDLYYRLGVFPISVPPLRERPEDIPVLAAAFLKRFARENGRVLAPLDETDRRRLAGYAWPGNVRELRNVIERAVITAQGGRLNLERALPDCPAPSVSEDSHSADAPIYTAEELCALERANILRALECANGRVSGENGAARLLGLPPSTLSSRMKALGIRRAG